MAQTVELSNHIYPICVPETAREINNRVNVGAKLAGWGATEKFDGKPSTALKETKMNVFSQSYCNNTAALFSATASIVKEIPEFFQSNLMCAGSVSSIFSAFIFMILALIICSLLN